jgi:hypothetical protein
MLLFLRFEVFFLALNRAETRFSAEFLSVFTLIFRRLPAHFTLHFSVTAAGLAFKTVI